MTNTEQEKQAAAAAAAQLVSNHQVVGLGTGSTATYVVQEIGQRVKAGLQIRAVPTSEKTAALATRLGIPLVDINAISKIDITIDGADEFTTSLQLIKGGGGALLREKIVASLSEQEIIIADSSKKVAKLGRFPLPVEVIPFASQYVLRQLAVQGGHGRIRLYNNQPFVTDEGNYIIDTDFGLIADPEALAVALNQINGVVAHGLFIGLASRVIMGTAEGVEIFTGPS